LIEHGPTGAGKIAIHCASDIRIKKDQFDQWPGFDANILNSATPHHLAKSSIPIHSADNPLKPAAHLFIRAENFTAP
jgi:hypothetical protein